MNLSSLSKIVARRAKRVGRGIGSGKGGHTVGRGQKGQKSRSGGHAKHPRNYGKEQGFTSRTKRLVTTVPTDALNVFSSGAEVNAQALVERGLLRAPRRGVVKLLARGKLQRKLTLVGLEVSAGARAQVEKAGGEVTVVPSSAPSQGDRSVAAGRKRGGRG